MERTINRNVRRGLIIALTVILLWTIGQAVRWFLQPTEKTTAVPVYSSTQQASVDYRVFYVHNNFFSDLVTGPGQAYITPLTQYIETVFNYSFAGDAPAAISGQYQVDAVLTGYILKEKPGSEGMEREKVRLWGNSWALVPPTPFSVQDRKLELKQVVPVDIRSYNDFTNLVSKELKFSADLVELVVVYQVQGSALTPQGEIREPLKAELVIPIKGSSFMIESLRPDKKEKALTRSEVAPVAGVKGARLGYSAAAGVLIMLLMLVLFKTNAESENPQKAILRKIIKKHGDRIVAGFSWVPAISDQNTIWLNSFEDLVKVADEIAQPILYKEEPIGVHSFYVIKEPLIYHYVLKIQNPKDLFVNQGRVKTEHPSI